MESPGLRRGGVLNAVRHDLELVCDAASIPDEIPVDLTGLDGDNGFRTLAPLIAHYGPLHAAYIATMHPGVGLALADWLDRVAEHSGRYAGVLVDDALRLADLILGGAA